MKLLFSGQGRYPDFEEGYKVYRRRVRKDKPLSREQYSAAVRSYCKALAERLCREGLVELPNGMGVISAATITRKPQYRGEKFIGFGARDYKNGGLDGTLKAFGMVFLPRHGKDNNLRSFGYVANRRLFKTMKALYQTGGCDWQPLNFNEDMI